ncbi:hypothetical protein BH09BAC3_BH09BAC3_14740 [soil metagenome]
MNNKKLNEKIFGVLALISCSILIPTLLSTIIFDYKIIDLNKGGLFILWTIVSIIQYYRYKLINILDTQIN